MAPGGVIGGSLTYFFFFLGVVAAAAEEVDDKARFLDFVEGTALFLVALASDRVTRRI